MADSAFSIYKANGIKTVGNNDKKNNSPSPKSNGNTPTRKRPLAKSTPLPKRIHERVEDTNEVDRNEPMSLSNGASPHDEKKSPVKPLKNKDSYENELKKIQKKHQRGFDKCVKSYMNKMAQENPQHSGNSDIIENEFCDCDDDDISDSEDDQSTGSDDDHSTGSDDDYSTENEDDGSTKKDDDGSADSDDDGSADSDDNDGSADSDDTGSADSDDDGNADSDDAGSADSDDDGSADSDEDGSCSDKSTDDENNNVPDTSVPAKRKRAVTNNDRKSKIIKLESSSVSSSNDNNNTKSKQQEQKKSSIGTTISNYVNGSDFSLNQSSIQIGKNMFQWLLGSVSVEEFFKNNWEQKPCYINSGVEDKYARLISFKSLDQMLLNNHLEYTTNVDVTTYKKGKRETLNPEGRATPPSVWSSYADGCSIRFLNPHVYLPNLYKLNSTLQEYFHSFVGANAYLTPPNSQGFAPHYDDIEAFVLQVEGRKRWRLYAPLDDDEVLPRVSSPNFKPDQIGDPIFDQILGPGDVLYFPRGVIHQACTAPGFHSLHITLSVYQKQSYADLLEKLMPLVLENAIKSELNLRRGIPLDTFQNLGLVNATPDETEGRIKAQKEIKSLVSKCLVPSKQLIDAAVDQLAKKYQHEALPPVLNDEEQARSIFGSRSRADRSGFWQCDYELELRTNVRLLRANILRLVREEGALRMYYHIDNDREYCKYEPNFMEIAHEEGGTIEMLIHSYPAYVSVSQFPLEDDGDKIDFATALWERGLLIMEKPFK